MTKLITYLHLYPTTTDGGLRTSAYLGYQGIASADETCFDIETGMKQDYCIYNKCADPRGNGVTDFCMQDIFHKIASARKLTPLERRGVSLQRR
jgi:hypothetical protein